MAKKFLSLEGLSDFLDNLKTIFAPITHTHPIDNTLSSTSTNPVQNKVVNAKFDAIVEESQTYIDNAVAQKTQVQIITWEDDD